MMKPIIIIVLACMAFSCKTPEARQPISKKSGSFIKESAERNIKLNEREQKQIFAIMEKQPEKEFIASESGFWYSYDTKVEQDTIMADFGDIVNFNYNIKDLRGNEIYSFNDIPTQNYAMDQEELFTGLREGLKLMKPGETVTFLFPSQKAYGYYGDTKRIGTNIPLICKVTVNSITKTQNN
ncbi:gliding motility-associated peptidyl-prolyl isomerase [Flavobacteriaceae bacterium MAR_2010_105]|nr:gliding motility-associated peptidyl-prolyl isomerase [Flavobacteriaceae bacterium MAR_2010_105]